MCSMHSQGARQQDDGGRGEGARRQIQQHLVLKVCLVQSCPSDSSAQRCEVSTIIIPKPRMRKLSLKEVS